MPAKRCLSCIIKGALQPHYTEPVIKHCKNNPFFILCDEGNDVDDKNFAILVHLWDEMLGKPVTRFLDMPIFNIGTAENLFNHNDALLD